MNATFRPDGELRSLELDNVTISGNGGDWHYREETRGKVRSLSMGSLNDCLAEARQRGKDTSGVQAFVDEERAKYLKEMDMKKGLENVDEAGAPDPTVPDDLPAGPNDQPKAKPKKAKAKSVKKP